MSWHIFNVRSAINIEKDIEGIIRKEVLNVHRLIDEIIEKSILKLGQKSIDIFLYNDSIKGFSVYEYEYKNRIRISDYSLDNYKSVVNIVYEELLTGGWVCNLRDAGGNYILNIQRPETSV